MSSIDLPSTRLWCPFHFCEFSFFVPAVLVFLFFLVVCLFENTINVCDTCNPTR